MIRSLAATVGLVALTAAAQAAPQLERVRGTVTAVSDASFTVKMPDGASEVLNLSPETRYLSVVSSSLDNVSDGKFIGTATKGEPPVALEVVIFPPSMKGTGEGHYDWDTIADTTVGGGKQMTKSAMTNGTVAKSASPTKGGAMMTKSAMTNGTVKTQAAGGNGKAITVTYDSGKSLAIIVPPTAPIVEFEPATKAVLAVGAPVFSIGTKEGDKLAAHSVAVGKDGITPPM